MPVPENAISTRYVRMFATERNGVHAGYSLYEMEVRKSPSPTNLALTKPATTSSIFSASFPASDAFDGDTTVSRWASAFDFSDIQWLYVDLQSVQGLTDVKIFWQDAYAASYQVQLSDNATDWANVFNTTEGVGGDVDIPVPPVLPSISGTPQEGQTLTASVGSWTNSPTSFSYQWNRTGTPIGGATASTYVLVADDVTHTITVSVTAVNGDGPSTPATSEATEPVVGIPAPPPAPVVLADNFLIMSNIIAKVE